MDDESPNKKRTPNSYDTYTLLDEDGVVANFEHMVLGQVGYLDILRTLETPRQKFIAIALENGYKKAEIAYVLKVDPSQITRETDKMQTMLASFYTKRKSRT